MRKGNLFLVRLLVVILLGIGSVWIRFNHQRNITIEKVDRHLSKIGIQEDEIKSKEVKYDYKIGEYYIEIIYKDEPTTEYEYIYRKNQTPNILVFGMKNSASYDGKHSEPFH